MSHPRTADASLATLLDGMPDPAGLVGAGGTCGCGGDRTAANAPAPVLSIGPRLAVRQLPHSQHATVLAALDATPVGGALVLNTPHAPRSLLAEIEARYRGGLLAEWLQDGPDTWQIRLPGSPSQPNKVCPGRDGVHQGPPSRATGSFGPFPRG